MFLDIQGFYDSVVWSSVVESGLLLEFPPLVLELALQLYTGERLLSAENSVSPGFSFRWPSAGVSSRPGRQQASLVCSFKRTPCGVLNV